MQHSTFDVATPTHAVPGQRAKPADAARMVMTNRSESVAQRAMAHSLNHGPKSAAQRRQLRGTFGDTAQLEVSPEEFAEERLLKTRFAENQPDDLETQRFFDRHTEDLGRKMGTRQFKTSDAGRASASSSSGRGTNLPSGLQAGIEAMSGISLNGVQVHYNSSRPAQLNALAYAQGTDIHVAPGQEQHLPHEAWHVVQQAQNRVRTTQRVSGVPINDEAHLEREADVMGARALHMKPPVEPAVPDTRDRELSSQDAPAQRKLRLTQPDYVFDTVNRDAHHLMTDVQTYIKAQGFTPHDGPVNGQIRAWIDNKDQTFEFANVAELGNRLLDLGLMDRPQNGPHQGPSRIGARPNLDTDIGAQPGEDRRHIFSSSSLGLGIEHSGLGNAQQAEQAREVSAFLTRHGVAPAGVNLKALLQQAWHLVSNHRGNLWAGPSVDNRVRGFIRSSFAAEVRGLDGDNGQPVLTVEEVNAMVDRIDLPRGPGMLAPEAAERWHDIVHQLRRQLDGRPEDQLTKAWVRDVLESYRINADIDLPQDEDGNLAANAAYIEGILALNPHLLGRTTFGPEAFAINGPLDQFLSLDHRVEAQGGGDNVAMEIDEEEMQGDDTVMEEDDTAMEVEDTEMD